MSFEDAVRRPPGTRPSNLNRHWRHGRMLFTDAARCQEHSLIGPLSHCCHQRVEHLITFVTFMGIEVSEASRGCTFRSGLKAISIDVRRLQRELLRIIISGVIKRRLFLILIL
jgi:hypothetical protein